MIEFQIHLNLFMVSLLESWQRSHVPKQCEWEWTSVCSLGAAKRAPQLQTERGVQGTWRTWSPLVCYWYSPNRKQYRFDLSLLKTKLNWLSFKDLIGFIQWLTSQAVSNLADRKDLLRALHINRWYRRKGTRTSWAGQKKKKKEGLIFSRLLLS